MNTFLVVPQWQGSDSSRALRLRDGAEALRAELPLTATLTVDVPLGAGHSEGTGVHRLSAVRRVRDATLEVLASLSGPVITIGGDRGVELASISHAVQSQDGVCLVWLGAHASLHTPASSPTGAFHGMVLRTLLGDGTGELVPPVALTPLRVVLAGTRAVDSTENEYLESAAITMLAPDELTPEALLTAIHGTGATSIYLHVDLDVLDPSQLNGVADPEPFGVSLNALVELIGQARARFPLAGAGVTEFAPATDKEAEEDMAGILRIISALSGRPAGETSSSLAIHHRQSPEGRNDDA